MIIIQANGAERELEEKILALLRREDIAAERVSLSSRHTLTFPELTIDGRSQQAFQNGTALALTRIEFNMLRKDYGVERAAFAGGSHRVGEERHAAKRLDVFVFQPLRPASCGNDCRYFFPV